MLYVKCEIQKFLEEIKNRDGDIIYIYNENEDKYYTIKDMRIDSENDIVFDIEESYI